MFLKEFLVKLLFFNKPALIGVQTLYNQSSKYIKLNILY